MATGIALKVRIVKLNQEKTMKFNPDQAIWEIVKEIAEKMGITDGVSDHSLFVPAQNNKKPRWLLGTRTLKFYDIQSGTTVEFKKKHRPLKVKLVDNTVKTVLIDDSETVAEITNVICKKVLINNPEEYSLRVEGRGENEWLNPQQGLHEQDVTENDVLILGKKFFYHDANIDRSDPVQLHLFYSQAKNDVLQGKYPLSKEEARDLAALQVQIEYGDHNPNLHKPGFLKLENYLPPQWRKDKKDMEKNIFNEHRKLVGLTEMNAKFRYVQLIRSLKTFGITFFQCKEKGELRNKKWKGKWVPVLIGITREKILRVDPEDRDVIQEVPLTHLKRWAAKQNTFTFDYGDYADDYYQVQTTEGEAMSQLIAGYIDIILKSRREALRAQEEDNAAIATAETIAHQTGVATATTTTSYVGGLQGAMQGSLVMGGGHLPQYQAINVAQMQAAQVVKKELPPSHKVNVIDIQSAAKAVSLLVGEMEAESETALEAYETTMTIDQIKAAIGTNAQRLDTNIATLLSATDPSTMDPKVINSTARAITQDMLKLANMARSAAAIGGTNDQDIASGAKQVASAIAKLLEATQKVQANPHDPKTRAALEQAHREVKEAMLFLKSAKAGLLNDKAAAELAYSVAEAISKDVQELCGAAVGSLKTVKDGNKMREINNQVKGLKESEKAMSTTAKILAPVMIDPEARKRLIDAMNEVAGLSSQLSSLVSDSGAALEHVQACATAVQKINNDIAKFVNAMETAEGRSGADLDFNTPHQNALSALAALRDSAGDSQKVLAGIKAAVANTNELIAYAKRVAETSNKADADRLFKTLANVNDAVAKLIQAAKDVAAKPADPAAQARMAEAAARLEACLQEVVTDAGASAVTAALRSRAKEAACKGYAVNRALEEILPTIQDPQLKAQLQQQIAQSNAAIAELLEAAKAAAKEPQNQEAQLRLLQATQKALVPLSQVVASTKRVAPGILDANVKQALNYAANGLADKLQQMMQAIKNVSDLEGQQEIEEALEQFAATTADLEAAEFAAQSGFLTPLPGQSREDGIALLDMNMKQAIEHAEESAQVAREPRGRKLGDYAKKLANTAAQVAAAVKTVASTTKDKINQKAILAQAKRVNTEISGVISAARALAGRRDDPRLQQALTNALTSVKGALSTLNSLGKGLDSREADEAIEAITKEAAKLANVQASGEGGANYKAALDNVTAASRAINAALGQLASVARANPRALGAAARLVAGTIGQFVQSATAAAAYAATQEGADALLQAAADLVDRCNNAINVAKQAAANKDQQSIDALNAALDEVAKAIEALQQRSSHPDADRAVNRLMELTAWLDQPGLGPAMTPQQVLDTLDEATQNLAAAMAQLVSAARMGSNKLGQYAKEATQNVEYIVASAKAATNPPDTSSAVPTLSAPGQAIIQAVDEILATPDDNSKVVAGAKSIAVNASKLIANAKTIAGKLTDRMQQQTMLKVAHALATATSRVARAAQAPKSPEATAQLVDAATELKQRTLELEASSSSEGGTGVMINVDPMVARQLLTCAKTTALNVAEAIRSSAALTADTSSDELSAQLSYASKNVTDAITDLLRVAQAFNPGKVQMDQTADAVQAAVAELDTAAIQAAVGRVDSPVASQKSHQDWQEELVNISRDLATDISNLVDASRQDANALRLAGLDVKKNIPNLVIAAKAAAATTSDPNLQRDLLMLSKELADAMLGLVRAAKDVTPSNRQSQQNLVEKSKKASQAIGKLVSVLKANVVILKELDESVQAIHKVTASIDQPAAPSGKDYGELKEQLTDVVMAIAEKASNVNSADRSNIGQIGLASKQLADMVPSLITKARDAIATTPDANAKAEIASATKTLANSIATLIDSAKRADPTNPQTEVAIQQAFQATSQASAALLKSLKKGAVSEQQLENALESVKQSTNALNSSAIFAQAGQLDPTPEAAVISVGAAQQALTQAAEFMNKHAAYIAEVCKGTQQQYAEACVNAAGAVKHMTETAIRAASKLKDNISQQNLLTAAKALAITTQQLLLSGREAQRKPTDAAFAALSSAVESIATAVKQLIEVSQAASAESQAAEADLEQAKQEVAAILMGGDANTSTTPEELIAAAKDITKAVSELVFAQNQEGVSNATKAALDAIRRTFAAVRGATKLTSDASITSNLLTTATAVGKALSELFEVAKLDRSDENAMNKLEQASMGVTSALGELVKAINRLPNASNLVVEELSLDMGALADQEMDALQQMIMEAAKELENSRQEVKNRPPPKAASQRELERLLRQGELTEEVLAAAKQIADATSQLVAAAHVCQKERKASPTVGQRYRMDPTWNNGLISAARQVSDSVTMMVKSANAVMKGKLEEEALIVSAKAIAASTAQLVTASRVRGPDANSQSQQNLSAAAKGVANATSKLLQTARKVGEAVDELQVEEGVSEHSSKIKEFEEQMRILKLEKELMNARRNLGLIRKNQYQKPGM